MHPNAVAQRIPDSRKSNAPAGAADLQDHDLVRRLKNGDESAYEELVRIQARYVLAQARRLLGNDADARDVTQETFLSVFRSIHRFKGDCQIGSWVRRIAVNHCLMKLRTRRRKPEVSVEELLPRFREDGHQVEPSCDWGETSDIALQRKETRALVRTLIDKLPDNYRTVLILRDIEEMDNADVARLFGVSPNAVKVRLHRARQALRTLLERHFQGSTNPGRC